MLDAYTLCGSCTDGPTCGDRTVCICVCPIWCARAHALAALEFDPDRFIDHRLERLTKNPMMFLPFNAGKRLCITILVETQAPDIDLISYRS
jgi:hypothetical protein